MSNLADIIRFYDLLGRLAQRIGGSQTLDKLRDNHDLPAAGVYFFFESSELRGESGTGPRVVRIGTHALKSGAKSTLRQRLGQHRGAISGGGNHRGSIFRLLIGQALLAQGELPECRSWGVKSDKRKAAIALDMERSAIDEAESPIERKVTDYIAAMPYRWLAIDDEPGPNSLRGVNERNTIALMSNYDRTTNDPPSSDWLGHQSNRVRVRKSGLWNQRHVDEMHDPAFFDVFAHAISCITNNGP